MELSNEGFSTMLSVGMLTSEIIDEHFRELNLGQRLLLKKAAGSLLSPTPRARLDLGELRDMMDQQGEQPLTRRAEILQDGGTQATQRRLDSGDNLSVADLMRLWGSGSATAAVNDGKTLTFDPFLVSGNSARKKVTYRAITDYISLPVKDQRFRDGDSGLELSVTNGKLSVSDRKLPLDKINSPQYFEASLKILREMVEKDMVNISVTMDYIGYLIKISTMAQVFQWQSVLVYDREYRKAQAEQSFNWGADNSYLMQLLLKPEGDKTHGTYQGPTNIGGRNQPFHRYKTDPSSGHQICERFNGRYGCKLQHCKYAHVCMTCFSFHSDFNHRKNTGRYTEAEKFDVPKN